MLYEDIMDEEVMDFEELDDAELEEITGGKTRYKIGGVTGDSHVRKGPGLKYKAIGVLHNGDEAKYLGKISTDNRGVDWYKIEWKGRPAWVSTKYTCKAKY